MMCMYNVVVDCAALSFEIATSALTWRDYEDDDSCGRIDYTS